MLAGLERDGDLRASAGGGWRVLVLRRGARDRSPQRRAVRSRESAASGQRPRNERQPDAGWSSGRSARKARRCSRSPTRRLAGQAGAGGFRGAVAERFRQGAARHVRAVHAERRRVAARRRPSGARLRAGGAGATRGAVGRAATTRARAARRVSGRRDLPGRVDRGRPARSANQPRVFGRSPATTTCSWWCGSGSSPGRREPRPGRRCCASRSTSRTSGRRADDEQRDPRGSADGADRAGAGGPAGRAAVRHRAERDHAGGRPAVPARRRADCRVSGLQPDRHIGAAFRPPSGVPFLPAVGRRRGPAEAGPARIRRAGRGAVLQPHRPAALQPGADGRGVRPAAAASR